MSRVTWICGMSCVSCYLDIWSCYLLHGYVVNSHVTWKCGHVTCYLDVLSCHVLPGYAVCHVLVVTWICSVSHVTWMRGNVTCYLDVRSATLYLDGVLLFDEERALLLPLEQGLDGGQGAWQRGGTVDSGT